MRRVFQVVVLGALLLGPSRSFAQQDLRKRFGTRSLTAAKLIAEALGHERAKRPAEGIRALDAALRADPKCEFALYYKALLLGDLGRIPEAISTYERCLSLTKTGAKRPTSVTIHSAINLGLIYCRLKKNAEANRWFTYAIVKDPRDLYKLRWKAYRNMGISLRAQGRHFSAVLAVLLARETNPTRAGVEMVREFLQAVQEDDEVAQVLWFDHETPRTAPREAAKDLTAADLGGEVSEQITALLADPRGRFVVALTASSPACYVIDTAGDSLAVRKVALAEAAACGALADDGLYVVAGRPATLSRLAVETGRVEQSWPLGPATPKSVAVFASRRAAYFPHKGVIWGLSMTTGKVSATDMPGQSVAGDPGGEFLYSFVKPDPRESAPVFGHVIIGGRVVPYHFRPTGRYVFERSQTTLFRGLRVPGGVLTCGIRDNVVSNGHRVVVSPDGQWVCVPGGGGWRPRKAGGHKSGYGVAVFSANDLEHVEAFFATGAYPKGFAFNPVTNQVAAVRTKDVRVYHLADSEQHQLLAAESNGQCCWSGNGRWLLMAGAKSGLLAYRNELTPAEQRIAGTWWRKQGEAPASPPAPAPQRKPQPISRLKTFQPGEKREDVAGALARAIRENRTDRPIPWTRCEDYPWDAQRMALIAEICRGDKDRESVGFAIYKLTEARKKRPNDVVLAYYLGTSYHLGGQLDKTEPCYLEVIRGDAGRTDLTCLALDGLHDVLKRTGKETAAAYCLAEALAVDRANPKVLARALPLLKKLGFSAEAKALSKTGQGAATAALGRPGTVLPKLPLPRRPASPPAATKVYADAVSSVVLVETDDGSGSGFCVAEGGLILTNAHVLGQSSRARVRPFKTVDGKPEKLPAVEGRLVYRSEARDIAVLKLSAAAAGLRPLPAAAADPRPGEKVYALGNPGMDGTVLTQSISEGIVSSSARILRGHRFVQHTAAINPGNSGGPLLNAYGEVVGLITLKADLENVGFAIPVAEIRKVFRGE